MQPIIDHTKLIEACKRNDAKAQMAVYKKYSAAMYTVCLRYLNNSGEAEDAMQEAFLKAFTKIHQFTGESTFGAWLKRIVVNQCIDSLNKRKLELEEWNENHLEPFEEGNDSENDYINHSISSIQQAIQKLPTTAKEVLNLYLFEGYDHAEIADITQQKPGTVRVNYLRAKSKLLELLQNN